MKKSSIICRVIAFAMMVVCVFNLNADVVVGKDGTQYSVTSIQSSNPLGIVAVSNDNGQENAAWIPYNNMQPQDQQKYGYDANKAADFMQKLNGNRTQLDDGTVISSPTGPINDKSINIPKSDSPIQGNQLNSNAVSGVTPVIAAGMNPQAVGVATPGAYAQVGTQRVAAGVPGAAVAVAPSGIGINTPIGNVGVSPTNIGVATPVANVGISNAGIGVQTALASIAITPGAVPEPMYVQQPVAVAYPLTVTMIPQPVYTSPAATQVVNPDGTVSYYTAQGQKMYTNPTVCTTTNVIPQTWIIYNGAYVPYAQYYGYWQNNWCYANGIWYPATYYLNIGWNGYCWRNPCNWYRGGRYYGNNRGWSNNYRGGGSSLGYNRAGGSAPAHRAGR